MTPAGFSDEGMVCAVPEGAASTRRGSRRHAVAMRVFLAGATGAIGAPLLEALLADGHEVTGMTRSPARAALRAAGAEAAVADALDARPCGRGRESAPGRGDPPAHGDPARGWTRARSCATSS